MKLNLDENKRMRDTHSIVPISAKSGEDIPDLLSLMVYWSQKSMAEKFTYINEVRCTLLEVNYVEGLGTTFDVILVNGTTIDVILVNELCVKGKYQHHSEIRAAQAIKITSPQGFKHAIAGTALYVIRPDVDLEEIKEAAMEDMMNCVLVNDNMSGGNSSSGDKGVCAQASAQGSLEAMLEFLKAQEVDIPVREEGQCDA
ncbi:PREDICTED: eukaryotic translation initiation factor 5B-like [Fragaria vesca subsp. vesca]